MCKPHLTKEDWDQIRGGGNPTVGRGEGYTTAHHEPTMGRILSTIYPAIKNPKFIRGIKNKHARHYFAKAFMAQEVSRRVGPVWAEALASPYSGRPAASTDVDNQYKEKYRNSHFENTVFRILLGIPLTNPGDDFHYRPADNYAMLMQRFPWGRQAPPIGPLKNDYDDEESEEDGGPPPLEENWGHKDVPQQQQPPRDNPAPWDNPAPREWSGACSDAREPRREESSRQREHQPWGTQRDHGRSRGSSRRNESNRDERPRSHSRDRGQYDRRSRDHHEHRGRHTSQNRDNRSRREPSQGRDCHSRRDQRLGSQEELD